MADDFPRDAMDEVVAGSMRPEVIERKLRALIRRLDQRFENLLAAGRLQVGRIASLEQTMYRAELVSSLPASASAGYLLVMPGDINLYIGAGLANPLRKIPTQRALELPALTPSGSRLVRDRPPNTARELRDHLVDHVPDPRLRRRFLPRISHRSRPRPVPRTRAFPARSCSLLLRVGRTIPLLWAAFARRASLLLGGPGLPYKQGVGGSSPSPPIGRS
jgi:hypothetical protein